MATAIEYGLIAALLSVAVIGGVTQIGNADKTFKDVSDSMERSEESPVYRLVPLNPGQEGILGFDTPESPMIIHQKNGSFRFTCPRDTRPAADESTAHPGDGFCVPDIVWPPALEANGAPT
jgi:Flp pilus assembly pilin Flp